jgi:formylmethanofuran dehydrogenase subunit E
MNKRYRCGKCGEWFPGIGLFRLNYRDLCGSCFGVTRAKMNIDGRWKVM